MDKPPVYIIREVRDFLAIPPDRLSECLREFPLWIALAKAQQVLLRDIPLLNDPVESFQWVDDGKGEVTVTISTPEEEIYREVFSLTPTARPPRKEKG